MNARDLVLPIIVVGAGWFFLARQASAAVTAQLAPPAAAYDPAARYDGDVWRDFGAAAPLILGETAAPAWADEGVYDEGGMPIAEAGALPALEASTVDPYDATGGELQPVGFFSGGGAMDFRVNEYPRYASDITAAEQRYGIPADLLARLLWKESRYRSDIIDGSTRSRVGAAGIAQFMPATAADFGIDPLDPVAAIDAAGKYLSRLYRLFQSWPYALAAYNWGPGNMSRYLRGEKRAMPAETRDYVAAITDNGSLAFA